MPKCFDRALIPSCPNLTYESILWQKGFTFVAGLDEAGRGALCGPIFAAAVILPAAHPDLEAALAGVRDSKQLSPRKREVLAITIQSIAVDYGIGVCSANEIDTLSIAKAGKLVFWRALQALHTPPQHLLLDYFTLPQSGLPQTALVKGDQRSLSIAAASILAKVARDELMRTLDGQFPGYGLAQNKGYGTSLHLRALRSLGLCPLHRRSFTHRLLQENLPGM